MNVFILLLLKIC